MKGMSRGAVAVLASFLPAGLFADCLHAVNTDYCGPELIRLLYVTSAGAVYVQPSTALEPAPQGFVCKPVAGAYFVLDANAPNFKQIYATLLSARVAGAPVTIVADPARSTCTILYVTL
jgi:hypothetical protein